MRRSRARGGAGRPGPRGRRRPGAPAPVLRSPRRASPSGSVRPIRRRRVGPGGGGLPGTGAQGAGGAAAGIGGPAAAGVGGGLRLGAGRCGPVLVCAGVAARREQIVAARVGAFRIAVVGVGAGPAGIGTRRLGSRIGAGQLFRPALRRLLSLGLLFVVSRLPVLVSPRFVVSRLPELAVGDLFGRRGRARQVLGRYGRLLPRPRTGARRGGPRCGVGGGRCVAAGGGRRGGRGRLDRCGVDGDRHPDLPAELAGERLADRRSQAGLQHFLGELVGCGQQGGVLDQPERSGLGKPRALLRGESAVVEAVEHARPHHCEVDLCLRHGDLPWFVPFSLVSSMHRREVRFVVDGPGSGARHSIVAVVCTGAGPGRAVGPQPGVLWVTCGVLWITCVRRNAGRQEGDHPRHDVFPQLRGVIHTLSTCFCTASQTWSADGELSTIRRSSWLRCMRTGCGQRSVEGCGHSRPTTACFPQLRGARR